MANILELMKEGHHDANATRYLSAVGLVILLYDHLLTFSDEIELVWKAKPSFAKGLFLFNRYLVVGCLLAVAYYMNSFSGHPISASACQRVFGVSSLLGVWSIGTANVLVLLRVVTLWDRNRKIMILLTAGFLISFFATFGFMVAAVRTLIPSVQYSALVRVCYTPRTSPVLVAVWASPMLFELLVLVCVCWNAIDRPRASNTPLRRVLLRDGIVFFLALTGLRILNLVMAAVARPTLVLVGVFFVWAMTTLVLNHSVLNIQKAGYAHLTDTDGGDLDVPESTHRGPNPHIGDNQHELCAISSHFTSKNASQLAATSVASVAHPPSDSLRERSAFLAFQPRAHGSAGRTPGVGPRSSSRERNTYTVLPFTVDRSSSVLSMSGDVSDFASESKMQLSDAEYGCGHERDAGPDGFGVVDPRERLRRKELWEG